MPARRRSWAPALVLALLGALAFWLYQPWHSLPFDVVDFSDFYAPLASRSTFVERFGFLLKYYSHEHGRFNVLSYAGLAAKWQIFGPSPVAWQLVRAGQLLLATAGTYVLFRRLAAGRWGAALGASLILFSFSSSQTWVRLTVPEPLGLLWALAAALLATRVRTARHWRATGIACGAFVALAILAKEMLVAWAPIVAYLGCYVGSDGRLEPIRIPDPRGRWVLASVGIATATASLPVFLAARGVERQGYATLFGQGGWSLLRIGETFQRMLLPWPVGQGIEGLAFAVPALLFVIVLMLGMQAASTDGAWTHHARRATVVGLALPVMGTLLYTPWPVYWASYGLPFLIGPALVIAVAVTSAERGSKRLAVATGALAAACIALVVAPSVHLVRRFAARQMVNGWLAEELLRHPAADSTVVALVVPPRAALEGIGPAIRGYSLALHPSASLPPVIDAQCSDVAARIRRGLGHTVIASYSDQCGRLPRATASAWKSFRYFALARFRIVTDTIRIDLFDPQGRQSR